jgi:hypothetical protein
MRTNLITFEICSTRGMCGLNFCRDVLYFKISRISSLNVAINLFH